MRRPYTQTFGATRVRVFALLRARLDVLDEAERHSGEVADLGLRRRSGGYRGKR